MRRKTMMASLFVFIFTVIVTTLGLVFLHSARAEESPVSDMVIRVKTDNEGGSDSRSFRLPMLGEGYSIDWEDDGITDQTDVVRAADHTYETPGVYTIRISGTHGGMNFYFASPDSQKIISIEQWGTAQWGPNMDFAFSFAQNLHINATDTPNTSHVTSMRGMFSSASLVNADFSGWDVSNVTNMERLFHNATAFNGDISDWNTSRVISMQAMFLGATAFNGDISQWDVSNVENMKNILTGASAFTGDLSNWDVGNVTDMEGAFFNASQFNSDVSRWDVSKVVSMRSMFSMTAFDGDVSRWDVGSVTNMSGMFSNTEHFNSDLSQWDMVGVETIDGMFSNAVAFNQDLADWNVSTIKSMQNFVGGTTSFGLEQYDITLQSWATQNLQRDVILVTDIGYCAAAPSRQFIIDTYGWKFYDRGSDCGSISVVGAEGNSEWDPITYGGPRSAGAVLAEFSVNGFTPVSYGLNCSVPGSHDGDFAIINNTLTAKTEIKGSNAVRAACVRAEGVSGRFVERIVYVRITAPQVITGASFTTVAGKTVLKVQGDALIPDYSQAFTRSLVTLNRIALPFCAEGFGLTAQEIVDIIPGAPVSDNAPCYWILRDGVQVSNDTQVEVWLPATFNTAYEGSVSVNGSSTFVFNPGAGSGEVTQPTVRTNSGSGALTGTPVILQRPTFSGMAAPHATVTVTVHSDPVSCTATASDTGSWSCTLPKALPAGSHTVFVRVVNPDETVDELGPYPVTVTVSNTSGGATLPSLLKQRPAFAQASRAQILTAEPEVTAEAQVRSTEDNNTAVSPARGEVGTAVPGQLLATNESSQPWSATWWVVAGIVIAGGIILVALKRRKQAE